MHGFQHHTQSHHGGQPTRQLPIPFPDNRNSAKQYPACPQIPKVAFLISHEYPNCHSSSARPSAMPDHTARQLLHPPYALPGGWPIPDNYSNSI